MKQLLNITLLLCFSVGFSQIKSDTIKLEPDTIKLQSFEDSKILFSNSDTLLLKNTDTLGFKEHIEATLIDSLWLNELIKSPLYDTIQYVLKDDEIFNIAYKYIRFISFGSRHDNYKYAERTKTDYSNFTLINSF